MNDPTDELPRAVPRWAGDQSAPAPGTAREREILADVLMAMRRVRHGAVTLVIQDGRVIQIDTTEKKRL